MRDAAVSFPSRCKGHGLSLTSDKLLVSVPGVLGVRGAPGSKISNTSQAPQMDCVVAIREVVRPLKFQDQLPQSRSRSKQQLADSLRPRCSCNT